MNGNTGHKLPVNLLAQIQDSPLAQFIPANGVVTKAIVKQIIKYAAQQILEVADKI